MNITKIKVSLTGEDLLSIYSEFVSVEGLEVKDIKINDEISITGRLNKGFNIDFLVNLKFESYEENVIKVEITKIKVLNIGVLKIIKNMAIKYLLKSWILLIFYNGFLCILLSFCFDCLPEQNTCRSEE